MHGLGTRQGKYLPIFRYLILGLVPSNSLIKYSYLACSNQIPILSNTERKQNLILVSYLTCVDTCQNQIFIYKIFD